MAHHHHHAGHHHHHHDTCCETSDCCSEESCHHHHHHHAHEEDFSHQLIEMADEAWMELLKEKIKEQIQKSSGSQLDKLAKLVTEANHERWKHKVGIGKILTNYKEKLMAFFQQK